MNSLKIAFPIIALLLLITACKNEPADNPPAAPAPAAATEQKATPPAPASDGPVHIKASNTAFLVGMWEYSFALGAEVETPKYKGRWIQFNNDDTFICGRYAQQTNQGTYSFQDEPKRILTLKYEKEMDIPYQWEIQGHSHNERLIFKGNTPLNPSGTQVRMLMVNERPTQ